MGKRITGVSISVILILVLVVYITTVLTDKGSADSMNVYKVNANGETYGSSSDAETMEELPDLVGAIGTDGTKGYVRKEELFGDMPKTTMEAIESMNTNQVDYKIPLYASDGVTVIGEFELSDTDLIEYTENNISSEEYRKMISN